MSRPGFAARSASAGEREQAAERTPEPGEPPGARPPPAREPEPEPDAPAAREPEPERQQEPGGPARREKQEGMRGRPPTQPAEPRTEMQAEAALREPAAPLERPAQVGPPPERELEQGRGQRLAPSRGQGAVASADHLTVVWH